MIAPFDVRCPRCEGRAIFDEPFEFIAGSRLAAAEREALEREGLHRWGGWYVREKYPSVLRWSAPKGSGTSLWTGPDQEADRGGYRLAHIGVVKCLACHFVGRHELRWPADAYFRWEHRGERLWAETAADARMLLHYIESADRDPDRYPDGYGATLRKLPAALRSAKSRAAVAARIRRTLGEAGVAPAAPDEYRR